MKSSRLAGHTLPNEGRISDNTGWIKVGATQCSCGEESPVLSSDNARKQWHTTHKDQVRQQSADA
jgi:hypothetical protein